MTPTRREAFRFWLKLGLISFGGPAGQIAIMHREVVERRRWLDEHDFIQALNVCMLVPGPEAMQLAIWLGWRLHGTLGGIVAGLGFIVPSVLILLALSFVYALHGDVPLVAAALTGSQGDGDRIDRAGAVSHRAACAEAPASLVWLRSRRSP